MPDVSDPTDNLFEREDWTPYTGIIKHMRRAPHHMGPMHYIFRFKPEDSNPRDLSNREMCKLFGFMAYHSIIYSGSLYAVYATGKSLINLIG